MNNSLRIQRDRLALEAISGADIKALLQKGVPNFLNEVKGFFNMFDPNDSGIKLTSKQSEFVRELQKHAFMDIQALKAYVPEGMEGTYLRYGSELLVAAMHASRVLSGPLSAYSVFLSQLISHKESHMSTLSNTKVYQELAEKRLDINDSLGECFTKGSTETERTFGQVTERNSDWPKIFQNSENIMRLMNGVDRKALNKKIAECTMLLEKIMDLIKRGDFDDLSPQAFENLSSGAYEIASELEFFAAIYYKAQAYAEALNRTTRHFQEVFKK